MDELIRRIISLTTTIEENGEVWGKDTCLGSIDELTAEVKNIIKDELISRPQKLRKRILYEMVDWGGFTLKELVENTTYQEAK